MNAELLAIIRQLTEIAPHVWQVTLKQVQIETAQMVLWLAVFSVAGTVCWRAYKARARALAESSAMMEYTSAFDSEWALFICICDWLVVLVLFTMLLGRLLNPEWAAINLLLGAAR